MMHGDISNMGSYNIGFRCENTLLLPKEGLAMLPSLFLGKWKIAKINKAVYSMLYHLYWNTEYSVSLVIDSSTYNSQGFKEYISDFPFNQVLTIIKSISEIESWLNTGNMTYFVTSDKIDLSMLHSKYMMRPEEFERTFITHNSRARNR